MIPIGRVVCAAIDRMDPPFSTTDTSYVPARSDVRESPSCDGASGAGIAAFASRASAARCCCRLTSVSVEEEIAGIAAELAGGVIDSTIGYGVAASASGRSSTRREPPHRNGFSALVAVGGLCIRAE